MTIASLTVRQAFGGTQLCGTTDAPYLFLKEISSDGNVQTVDVCFPFHPILIYTNPTLLSYLLNPLFINQESGQYPNTYSMHDLGTNYPNATVSYLFGANFLNLYCSLRCETCCGSISLPKRVSQPTSHPERAMLTPKSYRVILLAMMRSSP